MSKRTISAPKVQSQSPPRPPAAHIDDRDREAIPEELRRLKRWVVWDWAYRDSKWTKPPIDPATGLETDATNPANWMTFLESIEGSIFAAGSGFAMGTMENPSGYCIFDIDHCIDADGNISPEAMALVMRFNSYTERTPTDGIRIWIKGVKPGERCKRPSHPDGFLATVEVYSYGRYVTVTGRKLASAPSAIATRQCELDALYREMFGAEDKPKPKRKGKSNRNGKAQSAKPVDAFDEALLDIARQSPDGNRFRSLFDDGDLSRNGNDHSSADLALMNRLAYWSGCNQERMERLFSASALGKRDKWIQRSDYRSNTIDIAIRDCIETYEPESPNVDAKPSSNGAASQTAPIKVNEAADDPHRLGRIFLKSRCEHQGERTLIYHHGEFHQWEESAYRPVPEHEINRCLNVVSKAEFDRINPLEIKAWEDRGRKDRRGRECDAPQVRKVGTRLIGDINQAIGGMTLLSGRIEPPHWLIDNPPFPAADVLPTSNALVHLPSFVEGKAGAVTGPTPAFFCPYALDYAFDANAPIPQAWIDFLVSVWPKDAESINSLQEWLGYLLTLDKSQHKMALLIGPPRSGRGTVCRVVKKLIGASNVANPTLSGLATPFGAECLIGKPVAIIGDARQSHRSDWAVALERILGITGDDSMTIARKHKPDWTGNLTTRLILVSNELPKFPDQSGAIATRPLVFRFTESFLGREDRTLDARLQAELPGILMWAIEGWKRLRHRGQFVQPKAGQDLIDQMRDLSSPVGAFVRERCEIAPGKQVARSELFQAWKDWCADRSREHGTDDAFGRNLRAVCPHLGMTQPRDNQGKKYRAYEGIGLLPVPVF